MAEGVREQVGDVVSKTKRRFGMEMPSAADDDGRIGIVRGAWQAFGSGDHDGFLDALHDEVTWEGPEGNHFPGSGEQSGRDGVREKFITDAGRTFTEFGFRPESFLEADDADAVVVIGRFEGEGVEGESVDTSAVQVWEFEGNTVSRVRIFADSAAFPEVVTERKEKEWAEEDRKKEEEEKKEQEESEGKDDSDAKGEGDSDAEGKSDSDAEGKSDSDSGDDSGSDSSEVKSSDDIGSQSS